MPDAVVPVFHTTTACAGAATAHVLRRIAFRAGAYAPGLCEEVFHELATARDGGSLESVQRWFDGRVSMLSQLGYRLQFRRAALPTGALLDWVKAGKGYRGAMLPATFRKLHPEPAGDDEPPSAGYAVGLAADGDVEMIDPWPSGAPDRAPVVLPTLEGAHRDRGFHALVYYWAGWS